MKWLLYYVLGYSEVSVSYEHLKEILNFFNREEIPLLAIKTKEELASIRIYSKHEEKLITHFAHSCVELCLLRRVGIPQLIKKYRHRIGLISGLILLFAAMYISPMFIWQINITGLESLNYVDVIKLLNDAGVRVGAFSPTLDRSKIYSKILLESDEISWISVNMQGSSANVEIVERDAGYASKIRADGANIVAAKDGQILDANIIKGRRIAQNGEVVNKGALLVSGVYDSVKMGTRFVYADAEVLAKVTDEFNTEIPLQNTEKIYNEEIILEVYIKLFGKSINILKNYSKSTLNYDTIIREDVFPIAGLDKLPIVIKTVCALPYEDVPIVLSVEEALERAKRETHLMITAADYSELISTEESYALENDVLHYVCRVEAVQNIASVNEFNID